MWLNSSVISMFAESLLLAGVEPRQTVSGSYYASACTASVSKGAPPAEVRARATVNLARSANSWSTLLLSAQSIACLLTKIIPQCARCCLRWLTFLLSNRWRINTQTMAIQSSKSQVKVHIRPIGGLRLSIESSLYRVSKGER